MTAQADEPLTVKFRSRALLDAAVSGYGKESVQGYYRLEDFRVGFKATYRQYEMKADIGLGGNKVAIKDLLLNYHFKHGVLSLGMLMTIPWICSSVRQTCAFISRPDPYWLLRTDASSG